MGCSMYLKCMRVWNSDDWCWKTLHTHACLFTEISVCEATASAHGHCFCSQVTSSPHWNHMVVLWNWKSKDLNSVPAVNVLVSSSQSLFISAFHPCLVIAIGDCVCARERRLVFSPTPVAGPCSSHKYAFRLLCQELIIDRGSRVLRLNTNLYGSCTQTHAHFLFPH